MPISLRLPADIEARIAGFGARQGLTKSAVIVRSIQEFLARHAQPSSFQVYEAVMRDGDTADANTRISDAGRVAAEQRALKLASREAIRRKHAARSRRASQALTESGATPRRSTRKPA